jgi:hypothetical protein
MSHVLIGRDALKARTGPRSSRDAAEFNRTEG